MGDVDSKQLLQPELRYGLDAALPFKEMISYSLQHLTYFLANAAILPVIVGGYLGLDQISLASLVQRTFTLCGIVSILQAVWGHRFPIMEGPAGLRYGWLPVPVRLHLCFRFRPGFHLMQRCHIRARRASSRSRPAAANPMTTPCHSERDAGRAVYRNRSKI